MVNKDGGDAGGDILPAQQSWTERPAQQNVIVPGGGEIIISINDSSKTPEDTEDSGQGTEEVLILSGGSRTKWPFTAFSKTRPLGRKRHVIARSGGAGKAGGTKGCWTRLFSPGSKLLAIFLTFIVLSALVIFVSLATTKTVLEGCNWPICVRIRHGHGSRQSLGNVASDSYLRQSKCSYRRYVPHRHFPFLEIIHDFRSRHSVLVEWRHGLRCILFDMHRYVQSSDKCSASYPYSLDERLGVPASGSHLSLSFPRRFARHHFAPVKMNFESLARIAGSAIAERCTLAQVNVALLVDVRMENPLCRAADQTLVDNLLAVSDPNYKMPRSHEMSGLFSRTVVLYENWDKDAAAIEKVGSGVQMDLITNNSVSLTGEEEHDQLILNTAGLKSPVHQEVENHAVVLPRSETQMHQGSMRSNSKWLGIHGGHTRDGNEKSEVDDAGRSQEKGEKNSTQSVKTTEKSKSSSKTSEKISDINPGKSGDKSAEKLRKEKGPVVSHKLKENGSLIKKGIKKSFPASESARDSKHVKREAVGVSPGDPGVMQAHPPKPAEGSTLLSLVRGPVVRITDASRFKDRQHKTPLLLQGLHVKTEVRRYYLWLGRIIRVCQLSAMPIS